MPAPITLATHSPAPSTDGKTDEERARARRLRQNAHRDLGHHAEHALGADRHAEQVIARAVEMLAAKSQDFTLDRNQLNSDDIVGRHAVFQAMDTAGILSDVAADGAGDLAGRVGRVIEAEALYRVRDAEIGHPRLGDDAAIGDVDLADAVELAHAKQDAVRERQGAARQRGSGASRHDFHAVGRAIAQDLHDLGSLVGEHGDHWRLAVGGEPVAFEGAQLVGLVDHALAGDDPSKRSDDLRAPRENGLVGLRHRNHVVASAVAGAVANKRLQGKGGGMSVSLLSVGSRMASPHATSSRRLTVALIIRP